METTQQPYTTAERLLEQADEPQHVLCCNYLHHGIARAFCGKQLEPEDVIVPAELLPATPVICDGCRVRSLIDIEPAGIVACRSCPVDWLGLG